MVHLQSSKFEGIKGYAVTSLPASLSHCVTPHKHLMSTVAVYILPGVRRALGHPIEALCALSFDLASRGAATGGHGVRATCLRARSGHMLLSLCRRVFRARPSTWKGGIWGARFVISAATL